MDKLEAIATLKEGKALYAGGPLTDDYELMAHLIPKEGKVKLMRYFGESEWSPDELLSFEELEETWDNLGWDNEMWRVDLNPGSVEELRDAFPFTVLNNGSV